jgi:type III secretion system low calcium response chaperone LcrH/SycD
MSERESNGESDWVLGYDINDPKQKAELQKYLQEQVIEKKMSPKKAFKIPDQELEDVYAVAYQFYMSGEIKKALAMFKNLLTIDHRSYKFALGTALCCHELKEYSIALSAYLAAFMNAPTNPVPLFHSIDCWIELKDFNTALDTCTKVIQVAGDNPEYKALKEEATLLKKGLEQRVNM